MKPYYPGGTSTAGGSAGNASVNPFTNLVTRPIAQGSVADIQITRAGAPTSITGSKGDTQYSAIGTAPKHYFLRLLRE